LVGEVPVEVVQALLVEQQEDMELRQAMAVLVYLIRFPAAVFIMLVVVVVICI
jgi:hypothetical protein